MKTIWIVGKFIERTDKGVSWEFEGAFTTQKQAEESCAKDNYFVGPAPINALIGDGVWPGAYYPKIEGSKK